MDAPGLHLLLLLLHPVLCPAWMKHPSAASMSCLSQSCFDAASAPSNALLASDFFRLYSLLLCDILNDKALNFLFFQPHLSLQTAVGGHIWFMFLHPFNLLTLQEPCARYSGSQMTWSLPAPHKAPPHISCQSRVWTLSCSPFQTNGLLFVSSAHLIRIYCPPLCLVLSHIWIMTSLEFELTACLRLASTMSLTALHTWSTHSAKASVLRGRDQWCLRGWMTCLSPNRNPGTSSQESDPWRVTVRHSGHQSARHLTRS